MSPSGGYFEERSAEIVSLLPESWEEYKRLRLRALSTEAQAFGTSYAEAAEYPDEHWRQRLQDVFDGKSHLLFARLDGKLVGMVGAFQQDEDRKNLSANVISMYVEAEFRSRGIGRALLSRLLQDLALKGIEKARLDVVADQVAAKHLYLSLGFAFTGSSIQTLGDGREHIELQMELTGLAAGRYYGKRSVTTLDTEGE